jgi:hypothetical protein
MHRNRWLIAWVSMLRCLLVFALFLVLILLLSVLDTVLWLSPLVCELLSPPPHPGLRMRRHNRLGVLV